MKEENEDQEDSKINDKLVNVVYNEGQYYLFEPENVDMNQYNIIDNYLWLAARFMPEVSNCGINNIEIEIN